MILWRSKFDKVMFRLAILSVVLMVSQSLCAKDFADESLSYKIKYKWGLIHKQAGHATLTLKNENPYYKTQLVASSEPWADRFFQVRDTLNGIAMRENFKPVLYEKIAHEGDDDKHDIVRFEYPNDAKVIGRCSRVTFKKGREKVNQQLTLESTGKTVDMLSAFYYMRSIDYEKLSAGDSESITIFSGKRKETLTIKYHGLEDIKIDKKRYRAYHITFIFTSDGGKKTSDDMDAWISADNRRIPLMLEGKLPVGKVYCEYSGQ